LTENLDQLHRLGSALLEYETLSGDEARRVIKGEDIGRDDGSARAPAALSTGGSSIPKSKRPGSGSGGWGEPRPA